ncbi:MAG: DUF4097 family beta strand repeat protein, partial [Gammaproteobacteria bacterium]|nr:DUF4097 family beta strand repeat protein [Gammaproteobacteria bacterium]
MKTTVLPLLLGSLLGLLVSTANAGDCDYSRQIDREVDIGTVTDVRVEAGAGGLSIQGEPGRSNVLIRAKVCASDEELLAKLDVISEVTAESAYFGTKFPDKSFWSNDWQQASIDLNLVVPAAASLEVADSSGKASIENVAALSMKDSSGALEIARVSGNVTVVDSSGELTVQEIAGDVELTDSSGAIRVNQVKGSLIVHADSSGGIEAKNIGKNVLIKRDSSGAIEVKDVAGDFTVAKDSSGGIRYKNV